MIRWLPVAPGLFPARLMTPVERKLFPSYNSKQILRTESHSIGSSRVSIPEPITGARGINDADCLHLSHVLSLGARAGGCLGRAQFHETAWLCSPLLVLFSNTLCHQKVAKCTCSLSSSAWVISQGREEGGHMPQQRVQHKATERQSFKMLENGRMQSLS